MKVWTWYRDGGDGSSASSIYPSEEARAADMLECGITEAMCDDDPYENGSLGTEEIPVGLNEKGEPILLKSFSVYSNNQ